MIVRKVRGDSPHLSLLILSGWALSHLPTAQPCAALSYFCIWCHSFCLGFSCGVAWVSVTQSATVLHLLAVPCLWRGTRRSHIPNWPSSSTVTSAPSSWLPILMYFMWPRGQGGTTVSALARRISNIGMQSRHPCLPAVLGAQDHLQCARLWSGVLQALGGCFCESFPWY